MPLHIFCDFDGTIASSDIGDALFDRFGEREPWHGQLMRRELHIRDYWRRVVEQLRDPITSEGLDEFLQSIPVTPGFHELLDLARTRELPFTVVSDGFDIYIRRYLALHGAGDVEVFSNHAELTPAGGLEISYPYAADGCDCMCATCKRNIVLLRAEPEARIVYIGDGVSDFCPAEHADIIFAKSRLAAYCNEHRLPHYPFSTLSDVAYQIRLLLDRKRIRSRHQAAIKRKQAFEQE